MDEERGRRMKAFVRKSSALLVTLLMFLAVVLPVSAEETTKTDQIRYVALGDSLAAGMTPYKGIDDGYSDFIAAQFKTEELLDTYTNEFAVPGYTSKQTLDSLENAKLKELLPTTNLVTISAGANDILSNLQKTENGPTIDPKLLPGILATMQANVKSTITKIHEYNPEAEVYVMGYYFAFPHLLDQQKPELVKLSKIFNSQIEAAAVDAGAYFVPVFDAFGTDAKNYLPNPTDVHPNKEGYKVMAAEFIKAYKADKTVSFKDVPETHYAYNEIMNLAALDVLPVSEDGLFHPESSITRAEAALLLANVLDPTVPQLQDPGFKDVPAAHPAYPAIAHLTNIGVFSKAEYFNPTGELTRAQLAKIVVKATQLKKNPAVNVAFADVRADHWAKEYIDTLASYGIVKGNTHGQFKPTQPATKAQIALILYRTLEL